MKHQPLNLQSYRPQSSNANSGLEGREQTPRRATSSLLFETVSGFLRTAVERRLSVIAQLRGDRTQTPALHKAPPGSVPHL